MKENYQNSMNHPLWARSNPHLILIVTIYLQKNKPVAGLSLPREKSQIAAITVILRVVLTPRLLAQPFGKTSIRRMKITRTPLSLRKLERSKKKRVKSNYSKTILERLRCSKINNRIHNSSKGNLLLVLNKQFKTSCQ
jgi:hypothetical protein